MLAGVGLPLEQATAACGVTAILNQELQFGSVVAPANSGVSGTIDIDVNGNVSLLASNYHPGQVNKDNSPEIQTGRFIVNFTDLPAGATLTISGTSSHLSQLYFSPSSYTLATGVTSGAFQVTFGGRLTFDSGDIGALNEALEVTVTWDPPCP